MILTGTHCTQNVPKFHIPRPSTWFHKNCAFFSPIQQLRRKPDTVTNQHVNLWVCHGNHSYALCASRIDNYVCIVSSWPILTLPQTNRVWRILWRVGDKQRSRHSFVWRQESWDLIRLSSWSLGSELVKRRGRAESGESRNHTHKSTAQEMNIGPVLILNDPT